MPKHRVAIAAATCIFVIGVCRPVAATTENDEAVPKIPELDGLRNGDQLITLQVSNSPAAKVFDTIATAGNVHVSVDGPQDCCLVKVLLVKGRLREALEMIAAQVDVRYEVQDPDSLRVWLYGPVSPVPGDGITMPVAVNHVEPNYPPLARALHAKGKVVLVAVIRTDGTVRVVDVMTHAKGWPSMDEAAIAAVRQRTYRPAMKDGHPVSVYFIVSVTFQSL
jgi:TonB family protein